MFLLLLIILPINFSCTATLQLKPEPQDPVEFFLSDQGRHSSLLLPSSTGEWIEFTYGEWEWFAKNNDHWYRVPAVLFFNKFNNMLENITNKLEVFSEEIIVIISKEIFR